MMKLGCKNIEKRLGLLIAEMKAHILYACSCQHGYLTGILHGTCFRTHSHTYCSINTSKLIL